MKKSKLVKALAVTGVAMCCVFSMACGGEESQSPENTGAQGITCSETYGGAVSAQSYGDTQSAVNAYIANEISASATVVGISKTGDLTAEEKNALPLTSEQKAGLTSAEVYAVTYTNSATAAASAVLSADPSVKERKVYLLSIDGRVFYLDPIPEAGDELSKSYYESVLGFANYRNCTITQTTSSSATMAGITATNTIELTIKIDDDKVYYVTKMTVPQATSGTTIVYDTVYAYYYMEQTETGLVAYSSLDEVTWQPDTMYDMNSGAPVDNISDIVVLCQYDHSYLEKTSTGFTIKQEYLNEYVSSVLSSYMGATVGEAYAYYYVSDGVVVRSYARINATMSMSVGVGSSATMEMTISANTDANVGSFGTTVVETPSGIAG